MSEQKHFTDYELDKLSKAYDAGRNYYQIDAIGGICEGCCFRGYNCSHPYFSTKGDCTGKIYKEEQ